MKRKVLNVFLCLALFMGCFMSTKGNTQEVRAAVNVGSNPTPVVDIAVNVPADYPGTFLDFKQELTQKLIDQGMDPSTFRITSTAVSIDASSMDGWHVYDHYHSAGGYNGLVAADQRIMQPYRNASASSMGGPADANILNYINKNTNKFTNSSCIQFNRHIGIYQSESGATNMAFAGYGAPAYTDFMIYPAPSSSTRTFSFNIDASVINTHTLTAFGFFMNAAVDNKGTETSSDDTVSGYLLYFNAGSAASGTANLQIMKISNIAADTLTPSFTGAVVSGSAQSFSLGAQKKVRLTVELKKETVTIQQQAYDANGNLSEVKDVVRNLSIPQFADSTLNGFGPWVGYSSHGCSGFSAIIYTDLEMTYEASAFDALKYVQYYEGAEYKYFVNLAGDSGNPGIPSNGSQDYADGINRMNENELFYMSNAQDGQVVTDSQYEKNPDGSLKLDELGNPVLATDKDGNIIHQGLGSSNGCIATTDDYVGQMAEFISKNYFEGNHFQKAKVSSDLPLASFYVKQVEDDSQLMTIHLQHLVLNNEVVNVNIHDKSSIGLLSGANGKIAEYNYTVYDPKGSVAVRTGWVDSLDKIPNYQFTKNSTSGTYVFELTVRDQNGNESKTFQTYLTAYLDNEVPFIKGENTSRNTATITLTDTGEGIDEDGITFIKDGRGSGVAAYWVADSKDAKPTEDDWIYLENVQHSFSFPITVESTDPLVVWVKDECGNIGAEVMFQPIHVRVEDADGNPIEDYYVIGDNPIIVLPEEEDVPDGGEDDEYFSGWKDNGDEDVTPGTTPKPDENHEIVIRPVYSRDQNILVYLPNGGTIDGRTSFEVPGGSSILKKLGDQHVTPTRVGYTFTGWKLLKSHAKADAENSSYINNAANVEEINTQVTVASSNAGKNYVESDYYYLVAQWEVSKYTLKLDANGGSLGNVRSIENVPYEQLLTASDISTDTGVQALPTVGRANPTKPGYIFQGWSTSKNAMNDVNNTFILANGIGGITLTPNVTMPASDMTVYAVWKTDPNKFIVSFDSDGGSTIKDHAYSKGTPEAYQNEPEPTKVGYSFVGWDLLDENGEFTGVSYAAAENEIISQKVNRTFKAKWEVRDDTKYTVDYYYNSGEKNASGAYIYRKASDITKNYTGVTEAEVSVEESDKLAEITVNGVKYWFNSENANNVYSGVVSGNPTLSLKLYYERYFNVRVITKGSGSGQSAENQKEGSTPYVSWKADEGYHVSRVLVDGVVRDDLLTKGGLSFADIHENHAVYVEFAEGKGPSGNTPVDVPNVYQVETSIEGCADGSCSITPTTRVNEDEDLTINWTLGEGYKVSEIIVDGESYADLEAAEIAFTGIHANHKVVVKVSKLPAAGGNQTDGYYTVTVNRYGGDGTINVSPSSVVDRGSRYEVQWDAENEHYVPYKILVDGVEISTKTKVVDEVLKGYTILSSIKGNHVVDIYYTDKPAEGEDLKEPEYSEDSFIKVNTQIVGGPGTITGGAVIKTETPFEVAWNINSNNADPTSEEYTYYEVDKVLINGEEVNVGDLNSYDLGKLTQDTNVVVEVKPVMYDVNIYKYGNGTVSSSKTLYKGQYYTKIEAKPNANSFIVKIVVDGEELEVNGLDEILIADPSTETSEEVEENEDDQNSSSLTEEVNEPETSEIDEVVDEPASEEENNTPVNEEEVPDMNEVLPEVSEEELPVENEELTENEDPVEDDTEISEVAHTDFFGFLTVYAEDEILETVVNTKTTSDFNMAVQNISGDHVIEVYFADQKKDDEGNPVVDPETGKPVVDDIPDTFHRVSASIKDINNPTQSVAGKIDGKGLFKEGDGTTVSWSGIPSNYEIVKVLVNGEEVAFDGNSYGIENITSDMNVEVFVKKSLPNDKEIPTEQEFHVDTFNITTEIKGAAGTITSSGTILKGKDYTVEWSMTKDDEHEYRVKDVIVDGVSRPDLISDDGTFIFENVTGNHSIVVVIGETLPVNIDVDGDGIPDINIDTDGDGKPDVNIDIDGDGKPDINIDTDNTGEWKPSSEGGNKDHIWKPDTNIDKGDGNPTGTDYRDPIDEDGDGVDDRWKPVINVYPNGEIKPGYGTSYSEYEEPEKPTVTPEEPRLDYSPNTADNQMTMWMWLNMIISAMAMVMLKKRKEIKA